MMDILGGGGAAAPAGDLIKDVTEATFMQDVVEASMQAPVIVDFWAPWCGPCKTLGPALEAAVTRAKGAVTMAKIDVDQNQRLAQALAQQGLPLQSIPTVVAFVQGRPIDMFQGALPPSEIDAFLKKVIEAAGGEADGGLGAALEAAEEMLAEGAVADAAQTFAAVLGEDDKNAAAYGGLARAHIALEDLDQAEAILNGAPAEISAAPEIEAARAQIELARQAQSAGPVAELRAKVEVDPADHAARFDLAQALHAAGDAEGAVAELLDLFRRDRDWNDGAAKTQLFTIFDALQPNDPVVLNGRRKLSSMIFA
ncbi:tetratricopeptide repeat protein [Phaeobacter sp. QD34_3]|uniref:tetratricopeptide repeat protein n=1 Tax=unclassified Phaeobacter TaxID=2621772 RepID=UPI00237F2F0E|nr:MULTISPECIES: tetratricopeptide repeat protein [unclassified Phaeobacter]MDE4132341.1 tetratricopeptide repeat protein [Phaeobacter sp. QD34_3]MDE4135979.1 tetratricopeptide repeat protein [Phaeobacter sp. QD34_24]MDE4173802.1 tetratricopeptide repeat protein [Phaeobacter sp. PT47_59]